MTSGVGRLTHGHAEKRSSPALLGLCTSWLTAVTTGSRLMDKARNSHAKTSAPPSTGRLAYRR